MKISTNILRLAAIFFLAGLLTVSCTVEGPNDQQPEPSQTGFVTLDIALGDAVRSHAGTSLGIEEEYDFSTMRIIFYNNAGIAEHVESYGICDNGEELEFYDYGGGNFNNLSQYIIGDENKVSKTDPVSGMVITRKNLELPAQAYQVAVLLNFHNFSWDLPSGNPLPSDNMLMSLDDATAGKGHNMSVLYTAMDIYNYGREHGTTSSYEAYSMGLYRLTGRSFLDSPYIPTLGTTGAAGDPGESDSYNIFMSNADGLVQVSSEAMAASSDLNPVKVEVNVDRAVAKVILYKGPAIGGDEFDGYTVTGGKLKNVMWVPDILNYKMYPVRIQDMAAPVVAGKETAATPREFRYAKDPNWEWYSRQLYPSTANVLTDNFLYMPMGNVSYSLREGTVDFDPFEKSWATGDQDPMEKRLWYYVTENTMTAQEQYEDVTTRVLVRCKLIPRGLDESEVNENGYYYYQGFVLTHATIAGYIHDDTTIPEVLGDIREALDIWYTGGYFDLSTPPAQSIEAEGLKYYKDGVNYYSVPIRHFDGTASPGAMNYGRYGVVRNNSYHVTLSDISGPGSPTVTPPQGPDDKESNLHAIVSVKGWSEQELNFDF